MKKFLTAALTLSLLLFPVLVTAASTIQCHCYRDRTYDERNRSAADPYFLASSESSFLSAIYQVDKGSLVRAKMAGAAGSYLWILHDLAARSGQPAEAVAALRESEQDWIATFKKAGLSEKDLGPRYWSLGPDPERLADHIVDLQLIRFFSVTAEQLEGWRARGMNRKELILANFLEGSPPDLYNLVISQTKSWSQMLAEQGYKDGKTITRTLKERLANGS